MSNVSSRTPSPLKWKTAPSWELSKKAAVQGGMLWITREAQDREEPGSESQRGARLEVMPGLAARSFRRKTRPGFFLGIPRAELPLESGVIPDNRQQVPEVKEITGLFLLWSHSCREVVSQVSAPAVEVHFLSGWCHEGPGEPSPTAASCAYVCCSSEPASVSLVITISPLIVWS